MLLDISRKGILEVLNGESSKGYKQKNIRQNDENERKYALMKIFYYVSWLQIYINDFMYFHYEKMTEEESFPDTIYL